MYHLFTDKQQLVSPGVRIVASLDTKSDVNLKARPVDYTPAFIPVRYRLFYSDIKNDIISP